VATASSHRKSGSKSGCPFCGKAHPVWWNKRLQAWYITYPDSSKKNGQRQERLATGWDSHDDAVKEWHKREAGQIATTQTNGEDLRVVDLVNLLLSNLKAKVGTRRFRNTERYLADFCKRLGNSTIAQMRHGGVAKVEEWIADHSGWQSPSTRRAVVSRVKQVFKWGVDQGLIASSPIQSLKRELDNVRVTLFTPKQVEAILRHSPADFAKAFKILLMTGMRPDEFCRLTAADLHDDGGLHAMVNHKNQKSKQFRGDKRRIFLLFRELKDLFQEARTENPTGPLFRTDQNNGWSIAILSREFRAVCRKRPCKKLGLDRHIEKKNTKGTTLRKYDYILYVCRHTFAHRLLTGFYKLPDGVPIKKNYGEVGQYLGDSARMIEEVYGKLAKAIEMLSEEIG
jgi:integrase